MRFSIGTKIERYIDRAQNEFWCTTSMMNNFFYFFLLLFSGSSRHKKGEKKIRTNNFSSFRFYVCRKTKRDCSRRNTIWCITTEKKYVFFFALLEDLLIARRSCVWTFVVCALRKCVCARIRVCES